jgi:siroheme synthase-like protein
VPRFPLYIDLKGNNCTIFGGGQKAAYYARILLQFEAKVTIVSPDLCDELLELDKAGRIRYIPRRYFRGDCASCYICIAATDNEAVNITISDECKARAIAVSVTHPAAFGTFEFPVVAMQGDVALSLTCQNDPARTAQLGERLDRAMAALLEE